MYVYHYCNLWISGTLHCSFGCLRVVRCIFDLFWWGETFFHNWRNYMPGVAESKPYSFDLYNVDLAILVDTCVYAWHPAGYSIHTLCIITGSFKEFENIALWLWLFQSLGGLKYPCLPYPHPSGNFNYWRCKLHTLHLLVFVLKETPPPSSENSNPLSGGKMVIFIERHNAANWSWVTDEMTYLYLKKIDLRKWYGLE